MISVVDFKSTFLPPMGIKEIAKVAKGWFLGCDLSLDCKGGLAPESYMSVCRQPPATSRPSPPPPPKTFFGEIFWQTPKWLLVSRSTRSTTHRRHAPPPLKPHPTGATSHAPPPSLPSRHHPRHDSRQHHHPYCRTFTAGTTMAAATMPRTTIHRLHPTTVTAPSPPPPSPLRQRHKSTTTAGTTATAAAFPAAAAAVVGLWVADCLHRHGGA
nr:hypothetical protein [Tanacetum cinerariifolium]